MRRLTIFLLLLSSGVSVKQSLTEGNVASSKSDNSSAKVKFDFKAEYFDGQPEFVEVNCFLYNGGVDTIYLLTSTCDGIQYALQYNTSMSIWPTLNCNSSYPMVEKIPPKGSLNFKSHFRILKKTDHIDLNFKLKAIEKGLDVSKLSLTDVYNDKLFPVIELLGPTRTIKPTTR
jgi:hypothetical protein